MGKLDKILEGLKQSIRGNDFRDTKKDISKKQPDKVPQKTKDLFNENEKATEKGRTPEKEPYFDNGRPKFTEREVYAMEQSVERAKIKNLNDKLKYNIHQADMEERNFIRDKKKAEAEKFDAFVGRTPEEKKTAKEKFAAAFKKKDKDKDHER
jgi:hypothetical protein